MNPVSQEMVTDLHYLAIEAHSKGNVDGALALENAKSIAMTVSDGKNSTEALRAAKTALESILTTSTLLSKQEKNAYKEALFVVDILKDQYHLKLA
jgi:hypothetical protein